MTSFKRIIASQSNPISQADIAYRGAGSSFGVATKLTYRAHAQALVWSASLVFTTDQLPQVIALTNQNYARKNGNSTVFIAFANPPPAHSTALMAVLFYNGTEADALLHYAAFLSLKTMATTKSVMTYPEVQSLFNASFPYGYRRSMKGSAFFAPLELSLAERLLSEFESFTKTCPDASSSMVAFEFMPYDKVVEVEQTATAFANRGPYSNILFATGWKEEENDGVCRQFTRMMSQISGAVFERQRGDMDGVGEYCNYDGLGITGQGAFGVNYPRLVELKKKFDPENVFNKGADLTGS